MSINKRGQTINNTFIEKKKTTSDYGMISGDGTDFDLDKTKNGELDVILKGQIEQKNYLPMDYQRVEYIESVGTNSYINTGVIPTANTRIDLDFEYLGGIDSAQWHGFCGVREANPAWFCSFVNRDTHNIAVVYGKTDTGGVSQAGINVGEKSNLKNDKGNFYLNGVYESSISTTSTPSGCTKPMYLFGFNNNGTADTRGLRMKIYRCRFYDGNTQIRDMIPCYRKSDDVIGMYDTVNNVFYTNQGNGTFAKGPLSDHYNLFDVSTGRNNWGQPAIIDGNAFIFKGPLVPATRIYHFNCKLKRGHNYLVRGIARNIGGTTSLEADNILGFYEGVSEVYYGAKLNQNSYLTPQNDLDYIYIYLSNSFENKPDVNYRIDNLMIYEANSATDEREYEPYLLDSYFPIEIKSTEGKRTVETCNKNILMLSDFQRTYNGTLTTFKDNKVIVNGTFNEVMDIRIARLTNMWNAYGDLLLDKINNNPGTYVMSNKLGLTCYFYDTNNQYIANKIIITETRKIKEIFVRIPAGTTLSNQDIGLQIERAENATNIVEHKGTNLVLDTTNCPIYGDKDYYYHKSGKWYRHIHLKKIELSVDDMNNNEDFPGWNNLSELAEIKSYYNGVNVNLHTLLDEWYCNIHESNGGVGLNTLSDNKILFLYKSNYDNLTQSQFKAKYVGQKFVLYYNLPEDEEEEITDETLLKELNKLLVSYDDKTVITSYRDLPLIVQAKAPTIYRKLEYIKGIGNQYINTGYIPKTSTRVVLEADVPHGVGTWLFGSRTTPGTTDSFGLFMNDGYSVWVQVGTNNIATFSCLTFPKRQYDINSTQTKVDGAVLKTYSNLLTNGAYPLLLFTISNAGVADPRMSLGKIYSCKIYEGDTLVRDIYPVERITDKVVGMYDEITGMFLENKGSGTFEKGNYLNIAARIDSSNNLIANDFIEY